MPGNAGNITGGFARLFGVAGLCVLSIFPQAEGRETVAVDRTESARVIREVKEAREFEVRKIKGRRPKEKEKTPPKKRKSPKWLEWLLGDWRMPSWAGNVFVISLIGLLVALAAWLLWANRHLWRGRFGKTEKAAEPKKARVVLGMDVTPESLPPDVVAAARALHSAGNTREALALLYRAAISHCIVVARAGIRESDTEGDCVKHAERAGETAHPGFFRTLTLAWMAAQYARREAGNFEEICAAWPYEERRRA